MENATHGVPPRRDDLEKVFRYWPGGSFIAPHMLEGPYAIIVVRQADTVQWIPQAVMDAFPGTLVPLDEGSGDPEDVVAFALPVYAADMLAWYTDEEFWADDGLRTGPHAQPPGPAEWAAHLAMLLRHDQDAAVVNELARALTGAGLPAVAAFLRALDATVLGEPSSLATALAGAFAPAT